ncbi:MAG: hypothetical protein ABII00_16180 [Elusimicrobiota bacterium]
MRICNVLRVAGMLFFLSCFIGIFIFGETVPMLWDAFNSMGFHGRLTLPEVFGITAGVRVKLMQPVDPPDSKGRMRFTLTPL